jgi:predicted membrane protein
MTNHRLPLSRPAVITAAVSTVIGLASGVVTYLDRSEQLEQQIPGTEAWRPHLVVLAVVAVWFVVAARRSPLGWKVIFSPLGRPIAARIKATFRSGFGVRSVLRGLAVAILVLLEVYMAWRIGKQVFAGLDPNFPRNAWGGPSYLGAMFCHYLDGALLYPICHVLLRWITVPVTREERVAV